MLGLLAFTCSAAPYKQILVGYNGPQESNTTYFSDPDAVKTSWLSLALTAEQLNSLLTRVDFATHVLAVSAVGEREAVTDVSLESVMWDETSISVNVFVGVAGSQCSGPRPRSFPFVVAIIERPERFDGLSNFFHQNYPAECGPMHESESSGAPPNNSSKPTPLRGAA
ncbi:hypothetical protein PAGU2638_28370 [Lysobacter sp. PAGU 2638]